jgi:hypothetical protein
MDPQTAFVKTEKGVEEIETRRHRLDHRLRALLLVVNGTRTVEQLARDFARYGDVQAMLGKLVTDGFIRSERPLREVRIDVASTIYEALGPDSNAITLEVENCGSLGELRRYVAARRELFETALGRQRAQKLWDRLQILLA